MRKLILKTCYSLGDVVMMTAALRDLHRCYPKQFLTDVRTHYPEVWEFNPYITYLDEREADVQTLNCTYPLIEYANFRPHHCLQGYIDYLNKALALNIEPTEFKGDIHLSAEEKEWASQVHELSGRDIPFWIVAAGGKYDITVKWWSHERFQKVIDHFRNRIAFVQIGHHGHHHPKLRGAIDFRGQTNVRELIRLVYHAQGCLCPVTALMHLAAAVETKKPFPQNRACVVIAGGREPVNWEAYTHHQYLHTVGALSCCSQGGCWRSRVVPLRDGHERDRPDDICQNVVYDLPRCMRMITPEQVIRSLEIYFEGGVLEYLDGTQARAAKKAIRASQANRFDLDSVNRYNATEVIGRAIQAIPKYPGGFSGRGIIICAGGLKYFTCAWVCINMLRKTGCRLPVEVWYRGSGEMDQRMIALLESLGARSVDAQKLEKDYPRRTAGGWELKSYAMLHCPFREVLFLDADNVPIRDPGFLFEDPAYKQTGAIFWPDYGRLSRARKIWSICGIPYRDEPEFESGQMIIDKLACWRALNLAFWLNDHSDFFFRYVHGDKETFHLAWRKLGQPYTMVSAPIVSLDGIMCQHDLKGKRLFQHRNGHKWRLTGKNTRVSGFVEEDACLGFLHDLRQVWDGKIQLVLESGTEGEGFIFRSGTCDQAVFRSVVDNNEYELPDRLDPRGVIIDIGAHIGSFSHACATRGARRILAFEPEPENFRLAGHNLREFDGNVRLKQKAVWRSDRHATELLHTGHTDAGGYVNTGGGSVFVTAQASPEHPRKEPVQTVRFDDLVSPFKEVAMVKLDCEGSEWPILFTSKLLHKVTRICGEYHEFSKIPSIAQVDGYARYTGMELRRFLSRHYRRVRLKPTAQGQGLFWADEPVRH